MCGHRALDGHLVVYRSCADCRHLTFAHCFVPDVRCHGLFGYFERVRQWYDLPVFGRILNCRRYCALASGPQDRFADYPISGNEAPADHFGIVVSDFFHFRLGKQYRHCGDDGSYCVGGFKSRSIHSRRRAN